MIATFTKNAPSYATLKRRVTEFKRVRRDDDPRMRRPAKKMVHKVHDDVMTDR